MGFVWLTAFDQKSSLLSEAQLLLLSSPALRKYASSTETIIGWVCSSVLMKKILNSSNYVRFTLKTISTLLFHFVRWREVDEVRRSIQKTPKFTLDFEYPVKPYIPKDNFPKSKGLSNNYTTLLLLLLLPLPLVSNSLGLTLWQALMLCSF